MVDPKVDPEPESPICCLALLQGAGTVYLVGAAQSTTRSPDTLFEKL